MDLFLYEFEANCPFSFARSFALPALEVKTCQRTFFMSWTPLPFEGARRSFRGADAYEFLLRFACGLESEIKGETDVFGQLKTSVKTFLESHPGLATEQASLFQKLFEDTKEIRAEYLQGIGGNTYGALARRVLNPAPGSRVLMLGAGQISKSVAPYFADSRLSLFNRTETRLAELQRDLQAKGYPGISVHSDSSRLPDLLLSSDLILIATPVNSPLDAAVIAAVRTLDRTERPKILHLGGQARELDSFREAGIAILSLSDLFALEKVQDGYREKQIRQAFDACRRRALLRSLSRSIHIPHGWEDLALFY